MMESMAKHVGANGIGVMLSGMGSDGANAMLSMRNAGARTIAQDEYSSVVFGVPKEAALAEELAGLLEVPHENLVGKTSMAEFIGVLRNCHLVVTNDTGTMHLAAALGVRTVSIFGSTEPALTGPVGEGHTVIRHQVECSPCFLRECPLDFRCMKSVGADEVEAAVLGMLRAEG